MNPNTETTRKSTKEKYAVGEKILNFIKNELLVNMKYLDRTICFPTSIATDKINSIGTDGQFIYYDPDYLISEFINHKNILSRDYLHILLHCLFRHFDVAPGINESLWDLACDIAVENIIHDLHVPGTSIDKDICQLDFISQLSEKICFLSAEKIYHLFKECDSVSEYSIIQLIDNEDLSLLFARDDHRYWYFPRDSKVKQNDTSDIDAVVWDDLDITNLKEVRVLPKVMLVNEWKRIADIINIDLENTSANKGVHAGSLCYHIQIANRPQTDYRRFLQAFAAFHETMDISPDDFDYIYYTYGLSLYHNMPLIEPLEYCHSKKIREFAIAIDTSGSISKSIISRFLESTANILKSRETFSTQVKIYIVQCDSQIQHVAVINNDIELNAYLEDLSIYGYGGTDFRPVFSLIDELRENKEIRHLDGLLYFTDGLGTYPDKPTDYKTAFIFYNELMERSSDFPSWAMKILLTDREIEIM